MLRFSHLRRSRHALTLTALAALTGLTAFGCSSDPGPAETDTGVPEDVGNDAPNDVVDSTASETGDDADSSAADGDDGDAATPDDADATAVDGDDATAADGDANDASDAGDATDASDASETGVACTVPGDCPGADTECLQRTCVSNACGVSFVASGTALTSQILGDCNKAVCDGSGGIAQALDATDVRVDGKQCTQDTCALGAPANPSLAAGTSCSESGGSVCDGAGACVQCVTASTCPGTDSECQTRTCTAGVCGVRYTANDTALASQVAGDCKKSVCDGAGATVVRNDDADLPVDGNACTSDVCTAGVPSNPLLASGTSCGAPKVCDAAGKCVGCVVASDCPGSDTECQTRTCTSGVCGVNNVANGTALGAASQAAGDCQKKVCNGSGASVSTADNADVPVDGQQCTQDVCTSGVPSNPPAASGTACTQSGGAVCNATGACVECLVATTCTGTDTDCRVRSCTANTCGFTNAANGAPVSSQTPYDCQKNECDGAGGVKSVADDGDLPVDGLQCTDDVCTAGVPSHPGTAAGTLCSQGGTVCSGAGACVACLVASTCPGGPDTECRIRTCSANVCGFSYTANGNPVTTQTPGDCKANVCDGAGNVTVANDDGDLPNDTHECTADSCNAGTPTFTNVASGVTCTENGGKTCNGAGVCVGCNDASECPGTDNACGSRTCTAGVCGMSYVANHTPMGTQAAKDCKLSVCDGAGNLVSDADDADLPVDGNDCTQDLCTAGVPSNPPAAIDAVCAQGGGTRCDGSGNCVQCNAASQCTGSDTECQARSCTSGVCGLTYTANNTPVTGQTAGNCTVNVCNGAGAIVAVTDDADAPADDGNQCTSDSCLLGSPVHPATALNTSCNQTGGTFCDGAGACVQCNAASQCAGSDTECQVRTCNGGACGVNNTALGFVLVSQTAGNCQQAQCDGFGAIMSVVDNADVPVDTNQCTDDVCALGVPSNPVSTAGTVCTQSGGAACDGAGACVAAPTVTATTPAAGTTVTAGPTISVTFSAGMNPTTLTAQTAAGACSGSIQVSLDDFASCIAFSAAAPVMSASNTIATLTAAPGLLVNRNYKIRVTTAATSAATLALAAEYTSATAFTTGGPNPCEASIVISQVYGGNSSATGSFKQDFVELHNRGTTPVSLAGWSIQYASASGVSWSVALLTGTIAPGGYFLVQLNVGTGLLDIPTADVIPTNGINLSGTGGKVALVANTTALAGVQPVSPNLVDMVGYGSANGFEGAAAPAPSTTTAVIRGAAGCTDSASNATDFTAAAPAPRNSATPVAPCTCDTAVLNESGLGGEADYCNVQSPLTLNVVAGAVSPVVYGQVYELGMTETAGANTNVRAQLGFGLASTNPEYESGWAWKNATYNVQSGNNDEYQATFVAPATGSYRYVYRFSLDQGVTWTYCDQNAGDGGAGSNAGLLFSFADEPVLTSTP